MEEEEEKGERERGGEEEKDKHDRRLSPLNFEVSATQV